MKLGQTVC